VDDLWTTKSEDVGLIVRRISFQDFQPMWPYPPTSQTDGQTTCDCKTALCSTSRGKNHARVIFHAYPRMPPLGWLWILAC